MSERYGPKTTAAIEDAPQGLADDHPRCWRCNRLLAVSVTRPWTIGCSRCKAENRA